MKKFLPVALAALLLSGCHLLQKPVEVTPTEPTTVPEQPQQPQQPTPPVEPPPSVPEPPKMPSYDWNGSVAPLVSQMLQSPDISAGSVLLVNNVKNNTNGRLVTGNATGALKKALRQGQKFSLVPDDQLNSVRQTMGLSAEDSLESRTKAISLARAVNAQYVLYGALSGDVQTPELALQLMLVQSGEIIWSGEGSVKR